MYKDHIPLIMQHGQSSTGFADIAAFVIATQNQKFYMVGFILDGMRQNGISACSYLNTRQKKGISYVRANATQILHDLRSIDSDLEKMRLLVELPSIGIVKAGFVMQLVFGAVGCLDRHNLKMLGLSKNPFSYTPVSTEGLTAKLSLYLSVCAQLGTPEELYDGWCRLIHLKYPTFFLCADDVSAKHVLWCGVKGNGI